MIRNKLIEAYKTNGYSDSEAKAETDFAIEIVTGKTKKDFVLGYKITTDEENAIKKAVERRLKTKEPLAQILGKTFFMNKIFSVTKDTLIPRPETELLVNKAVELIERNNYKQVLDLGTGSGCIACMIAQSTEAQVLGVDISKNALNIALNNAMSMDLMNKALFRKSDFFSNVSEKYDLIVSNPPYIPQKEKENLQFEVKEFEPELALFTQDEYGIENYEKIICNAHNHLNEGGHVVFELGIGQFELVQDLFNFYKYGEIQLTKDLSGIERVICARILTA